MSKRDTQKTIDEGIKSFNHNSYYDMSTTDIKYIIDKYEGESKYQQLFDAMVDCFYYGYEMGRRATKKQMKKSK